MENNKWIQYKIDARERLKAFCIKILKLSERFPKTTRANVINYQLSKSGTSVYAKYRAALRGRSKAEFLNILSITVEEANETEMWIDLCIASGIFNDDFINELHTESLELLKILSNMRKNVT